MQTTTTGAAVRGKAERFIPFAIAIGKCLNESEIFEEWVKGVDGYSQMNEDEKCEVCSQFFNEPLWEFLDIIANDLKQELVAARRTP